MNVVNPFPRLFAETARLPENKRILDELGAYLTSVALTKPRPDRLGYSWEREEASWTTPSSQ